MDTGPSNAVFISYRREVGGILAMALYQSLSERGVDAFYDIESIRAGQFDTAILGQIASRPYFVLVLTPGTLERCGDEGDWVRREIAHALTTERVIIPAYTPNFDFKDFERYLPRALGHEVARFNGQELDQKWFKFAVQQLTDEFLVPIELAGTQLSRADAAVVEQIQRQARAAPAVTTVELSAQTSFERAFIHHNNGELAAAIAAYNEAIRLNPAYAVAFYNRGIARGDAGDLRGAIADYDAAIRLDPEFAFAFHNRGNARRNSGDLHGAIADFSEAIRLNPGDFLSFGNRGSIRGSMSDLEGAIADSSEAIRLNPNYAMAFFNRAIARAQIGDVPGAISDVERAAILSPGDPAISKFLQQLKAGR